MTSPLSHQKCKPCEGGVAPLSPKAVTAYLPELPGWQVSSDHKFLSKEFVMKNFLAAVEFIQKLAAVAEAENRHPDLHLTGYRKLKVELTTHAIGGLSENDFILAA